MQRRKIQALAEVVVAAADKEETPVPLDNPPHHPAAQVVHHPRRIADAPAIRVLHVIETEVPALLPLPETPAHPVIKVLREIDVTVVAEARLLQHVIKGQPATDATAAAAPLLQRVIRARAVIDVTVAETRHLLLLEIPAHPVTKAQAEIAEIAAEAAPLLPEIRVLAETDATAAEARLLRPETHEIRDLPEIEAEVPILRPEIKAQREIVAAIAILQREIHETKTLASDERDATVEARLDPARRETVVRKREIPDMVGPVAAYPIIAAETQTSLHEADQSTTRIARTLRT